MNPLAFLIHLNIELWRLSDKVQLSVLRALRMDEWGRR